MTITAQIARIEQAMADLAAQVKTLKALQSAVQKRKGSAQ